MLHSDPSTGLADKEGLGQGLVHFRFKSMGAILSFFSIKYIYAIVLMTTEGVIGFLQLQLTLRWSKIESLHRESGI
jgi:hypothetical protein